MLTTVNGCSGFLGAGDNYLIYRSKDCPSSGARQLEETLPTAAAVTSSNAPLSGFRRQLREDGDEDELPDDEVRENTQRFKRL